MDAEVTFLRPTIGDKSEVVELRAKVAELQDRLRMLDPGIKRKYRASSLPPDVAERVDDFAETMGGWFWETDEENRFTYMSPNVENFTGLPPEWHYGKRREDLGCPDSLTEAEWGAHLSQINRRMPFDNFVFRRIGLDGGNWLRTSGVPIFDSNGKFLGHRGTAADVSTLVAAQETATRLNSVIEEKNHIFEAALSTIPDGVQVVNRELELIAWNDQLFTVLDLDKKAILTSAHPGRAIRYALAERGEFGPGNVDELVAAREAVARAQVPIEFERKQVTGKWIECRGSPIIGGSYLAVYRDISESRAMYERLEAQASTDCLTGVANRRSFMQDAVLEFERARRTGRPLTFFLLDIDHFKRVNDTYGHTVGDQTLQRIVAVCERVLRRPDRLARFGGEEFVVMLPETDNEGAAIVAERLRHALAREVIRAGTADFSVTTSIGVAAMGQRHDNAQDVIAEADLALYAAKGGGRNKVVCA